MSASVHPPERNPDPLLDIEHAAQYTGSSVRFLRRLTHEKRIQVVRIGGRVRFRRSALDAFLAAGTRQAERTGPPADKAPIPRPKYIRKLNTDAAPSGSTIYAERADPITPRAKDTDSGPAAG